MRVSIGAVTSRAVVIWPIAIIGRAVDAGRPINLKCEVALRWSQWVARRWRRLGVSWGGRRGRLMVRAISRRPRIASSIVPISISISISKFVGTVAARRRRLVAVGSTRRRSRGKRGMVVIPVAMIPRRRPRAPVSLLIPRAVRRHPCSCFLTVLQAGREVSLKVVGSGWIKEVAIERFL